MMEVPTLAIRKTSTCLTLPSRTLTSPRSPASTASGSRSLAKSLIPTARCSRAVSLILTRVCRILCVGGSA